jgi:hypothetical protein
MVLHIAIVTKIYYTIQIVVLSRTYSHTRYISFTHETQVCNSILLPALGPLHLGIHRFPLELLVPAPLVEDRPASVRSNLKKGQYIKTQIMAIK